MGREPHQWRATTGSRHGSSTGSRWANTTTTATRLTVAYLRDFGEHWQLGAEWLRIHSTFGAREDGVPPTLDETQTQLVVKYRLRLRY